MENRWEETTGYEELNTTQGSAVTSLNSDTFRTFMAIYFGLRGLQAVAAILGNILTISAVAKFERLQTTTNVFVVSLAVNDLLSGVLLFPLDIWSHYYNATVKSWYTLCLVKQYISVVVVWGNVFNICLIAVERYIYLHFPIRYPILISDKKANGIVIGVWLFLLVICAIFILVFSNDKPGTIHVCDYKYLFPEDIQTTTFVAAFGVVSGITVIIYIKIAYLAVRKSRTNCNRVTHSGGMCRCFMSSVQMKVTKMLAMVLGIYFLLYLPAIIITPFVPFEDPPIGLLITRYLLICLWFANSWCNPLIYAWQIQAFQVAFRKMLHLPKIREKSSSKSHHHAHTHSTVSSGQIMGTESSVLSS